MKNLKIIFTIVIVITVYSCYAGEKSNYSNNYPSSGFKLQWVTKVNDTLYFDSGEIDVAAWLSYMSWVFESQGEQNVKRLLPDSTAVDPQIWHILSKRNKSFCNEISFYTGMPIGYFDQKCDNCTHCDNYFYRSHCPFLDFPITGLTFEQVNAFCIWRTERYKKYNISFRLPTEKEWKSFALNSLSSKEQAQGFKDSLDVNNCKECPKFNYFKENQTAFLHYDGMFDKSPCDLFGNVSEMTTEKGIAKGGNYLLYAKQCHPDSVQRYSKPEKWLGFRCIRVVKK